jgi:diacylglycerol kinase family enzyme
MAARIMTSPDLVFTTTSLGELEHAARQIASHPEVAVLGVFGGDSTASSSLKSVISKMRPDKPNPLILHLVGGTMNTVARSAGLVKDGDRPEDIVHLAQKVRMKIDAGLPLGITPLAPLCINDDYGFLFGAGTAATFLEEYYKDPVRGKKRAIKVFAETFVSELSALLTFRKKARHTFFSKVDASVIFPEGHDPRVASQMTHTVILCGTVEHIGLGCKGLPLARSVDGCFHLRSTNTSFWGTLMSSPLLFAGSTSIPSMFDAVVPSAKIKFVGPAKIMIDGDVKPAEEEYSLSMGPTLNFITG